MASNGLHRVAIPALQFGLWGTGQRIVSGVGSEYDRRRIRGWHYSSAGREAGIVLRREVGMTMNGDLSGEDGRSVTRRVALKRGAVVGAGLLWAVPAVQIVAMTQNSAEAASGPVSQPQPPGPKTEVLPETFTRPTPTPTVQGINFEQQPPSATSPTAALPFTGAAVPVTGAVAVGAGLVATGAVAVAAATRRRQHAAAATAAPMDGTSDSESPAV
jgi:hypothetical protein